MDPISAWLFPGTSEPFAKSLRARRRRMKNDFAPLLH
jgi:hypothetical protein